MTSASPLYPIGAAARLVGLSERTLRDYEAKGLITPRRDASGRRLYADSDITQIREIANRPRRGRTPQTAPATA